MSDISRRIAALPAERKALLELQLKKKAGTFNSFPLSFAQQRLWLLDQLEPGNPSYDIACAVRFHGRLDVNALEQSINAIVQRHESLRTTFAAIQGKPVQVIAPVLQLALPVIDLNALHEEEQEAEVQRLVVEEAHYSFDLARGPLIRIKLLRQSGTEHVMFLNTHHIISDGWSMGVFMSELSTIYAATLAGQTPQLPRLPIQYADYAVWQRKWLQGAVLEQKMSYWRQRLAGAPTLLELPTDRPRPALQTYHGEVVTLTLPGSLSAELRSLSQQQGITLYMTLLALFLLLLQRYSGQTDLVVGTPIANRNRKDIEGLIGFFVNTLVLRFDLSGSPTFRDLLKRVEEVTLGAYEHQDFSFDRLLEELNPERSLSHSPLFQVFFNMSNLPEQRSEWPGLTVSTFWPREVGSKFDLTLFADDQDDEIKLELLYNADLFDESRMREMLNQYALLALQAVHSNENISQFSLVTSSAQAILPDTTAPLSTSWEGAVHTLFAEQAGRVPEQQAVLDDLNTVSYKELNALSNRLANYLLAQGIQPQDVVAIRAYRCATLVLAILGIFKAGATFLILDPAYPTARLIDYLEMAQVRGWLNIASAMPGDELEAYAATLACCRLNLPQHFTEVHSVLMHYPSSEPHVEVGPDNVAAITFTSGSTGRPKGIQQRHGPLTHFLPWQKQHFDLQDTDRYSMLSGLSHDPLQREIFTPLCLGATIVIPTPEHMGNPGWLAQWMCQQEISIASLTPAMIQLLTQTAPEAITNVEITSLRCAFIVGDVLTRHDIIKLRDVAPRVTCINFYGSTETQRSVSYFLLPNPRSDALDPLEELGKEIIPLGRGIPGTQLLVLNQAQRLAGIGEFGEIYVRSPHLARGYLGDATLTQQRFIINPFTNIPDDRLYKTGDLGRYRPDGNVDYIGRNDQQIKLRGYRIELGEIEALLGQHPAVREAVVISREDVPGNKYLVAYIVPAQTASVHSEISGELRNFLAEQLPAYMIPAVFVTLEHLPLTPNGKLDRRALPEPHLSLHTIGSPAEPRTQVEKVLAEIWTGVLGRNAIGIHDNFFDLGGHSLLATQLLARINEALQVELSLRTLFEAPTIAGLAVMVERSNTQRQSPPKPQLVPLARKTRRIQP